jgi:hypothetical protein
LGDREGGKIRRIKSEKHTADTAEELSVVGTSLTWTSIAKFREVCSLDNINSPKALKVKIVVEKGKKLDSPHSMH